MPGLDLLAEQLRSLGTKRVLILAPPSRRHVDRVLTSLAAFSPAVFDGARVHVPADVVDAAAAKLRESGADTLVAIGGGSPIGLGKALRLTHDVRFVAIPTTYAGSEMTSVYGITRDGTKQTGRDARVKPDLVVYDVALTRDLPMTLTVQSLLNAFAHVASTGATAAGAAGGEAGAHVATTTEALDGAATVLRAIEDLLLAPTDANAREAAMRGASACAAALERGKPGAQHALAHLLGGSLGLDHAALHAVLLPQFLSHLRTANPTFLAALERAVDRRDLDGYIHDLLVRARAPVSLDALGAKEPAVRALLATRPELPAAIALDAQHGLRPTRRLDIGPEPHALFAVPPDFDERAQRAHRVDANRVGENGVGPHLGAGQNATRGGRPRVILALHGRGAEPGTLVRRLREITGPDTVIIGLRAEEGADRWYGVKYNAPGANSDDEVNRAVERVETVLDKLPADTIIAGFSQGACLALEVAARHRGPLGGVVAICGARIGLPTEWGDRGGLAFPVLVGCAFEDKFIARGDIDETITWFQHAGASVIDVSGPGDRHEITLRQRVAIRTLLGDVAKPSAGFGNTVVAEAIPGAVPAIQNSPRVPPHGLYAEQLNGTGFTAHRADNQRSWLYRVRPSAQRRIFSSMERANRLVRSTFIDAAPEINLCGFAPLPIVGGDFVDGLVTVCGAGAAGLRRGYAFHLYTANRSMESRAFYNADGDLLILPERGALTIATEMGMLDVAPGHVAVIPRGIVFSVLLHEREARGYVAEAFGRHFKLPDRGPIGANGLADARHFRSPGAWFEDRLAPDFRIIAKLGGQLHEASQDHSPFDVAGWHGNYAPYVYDLDAFSSVGNTRFDHGDPSVFTVLSAPLDEQGAHTLDLVVFPARVDATTGTFRPPFFHRNPVAEINGIIREQSPATSPFQPGCVFITPSLTAHGVSGRAVERMRSLTDAEADKVMHLGGPKALWFQLESALSPTLTPWAQHNMLPDWAATWGSHRGYY
jgi:homogentisate 1,2-dioxygenase